MSKTRKISGLLFMMFLFGFTHGDSMVAFAQTSSPEGEFTLEEITVTATKREANLQEIPLSATSVIGDELQKTGRTVLTEMLRDTVGVEIRGTAQDQGIFIRGIGENTMGMGVETNVSISVNGVYSTAAQINRMSHFDVARVEVTRGPDSTLNGRTAEGGSVSIITNKPSHNYEGSGSVQAGNLHFFTTQGMVNVPMGEQFALRGAFTSVKRDGFVSNGMGDLDNFSARFRGLYEPTDKLEVVLTAENNRTGGKGRGASAYTAPIDVSKPFTTPKGPFYNPTIAPNYEYTSAYNYYADITYDFGWGSLYFQPTYQKTDYANARYNRGYTANSTDDVADTWNAEFTKRDQTQSTYELRLTSADKGSAFTWLAGIFYVDFKEVQEFIMPPPNQTTMPAIQYPIITSASNYRTTKDKALYFQAAYDLTETLNLTVGGRYTDDEKKRPALTSQTTYYYTLNDGIVNSTTGARVFFGVTAETAKTKRFDYKISLQKELNKNSMIYGLVSTGFKGGGFNILPADPTIWNPGYSQFYDPEFLTSYEIGAKNQLLNNTLRLNTSLFYYNYQDIQLSFQGTPVKASTGVDPDWRRAVIQNGGTAVTYGAEIETSYLVSAYDRIGVDIAYLHTEFKDLSFAPLGYLKGMELPQSPAWRISPKYAHSFYFADHGELMAEIYGNYVSGATYQIPTSTNDPYNNKDGYFKAHATVTYTSDDGKWALSGFVRNMFDKQTYDAISAPRVYSGYSNITFMAAEPRTYGLTLSANF